MKNNTEVSKKHLELALAHLPLDNNLSETRLYLKKAINELNAVQNKKSKKEVSAPMTPAQKWEFDLKTGQLSFSGIRPDLKAAQNALQKIEEMIAEEEAKLPNKSNDGNSGLFLG